MGFFFVETALAAGIPATIEGDAAHHIRDTRRVRAGETIELQDTSGMRWLAAVKEAEKRSLVVEPLKTLEPPQPPRTQLTLAQAFIAEQKLDLIIQKATELGAHCIIIWYGEYSPQRIPADRISHKIERWHAIAKNACEQSGRADIPAITLCDSLKDAHMSDPVIMLDQSGTDASPEIQKETTLVVGPEGGFSPAETQLLAQRSVATISLSPYTLRAETAAIAGLSVLIR